MITTNLTNDYCGINSQPWKKAIEINMSLREEISMKKNPGSAVCGGKTWIFFDYFYEIVENEHL